MFQGFANFYVRITTKYLIIIVVRPRVHMVKDDRNLVQVMLSIGVFMALDELAASKGWRAKLQRPGNY